MPTLKSADRHQSGVVIARLQARPDMQQRLAVNFEAYLAGRQLGLRCGLNAHLQILFVSLKRCFFEKSQCLLPSSYNKKIGNYLKSKLVLLPPVLLALSVHYFWQRLIG